MPRRKKEKGIRGFGSVYKRGSDGRYVAKFKSEGTKRGYKELYAHSESEAYDLLEQAWLEHKQGVLATGPQQKLKDYLPQWLEDVYKPTVRISTYVKHRSVIKNHILPELGNVKVQKLTPQQVQKFYTAKLGKGGSTSIVYSIHAVLHKSLDNAMRWGLTSRNVCDLVDLPHPKRREAQPLTLEQARHLLDAAKGHRLEGILTLAVATGMRIGELSALRWQNVNLEENSLQVLRTVTRIGGYGYVESEPKTAKGRRNVMLPSFVVEVLKRHRTRQLEIRLKIGSAWRDRDLVFPNTHGDFQNPDYLLDMFYKLLEHAGLPHIHFHDLRHSAATIFLAMGINPKLVQDLLGHSQIGMTLDIYSHVLPPMQRDMMDKLNEVFGE